MRSELTRIVIVMAMGLTELCQAGTPPAGTKLADKQELTRNNGSEPDTLDPALAQGVPANNVLRDLFEGLTAIDGAGVEEGNCATAAICVFPSYNQ